MVVHNSKRLEISASEESRKTIPLLKHSFSDRSGIDGIPFTRPRRMFSMALRNCPRHFIYIEAAADQVIGQRLDHTCPYLQAPR